MSSPESRASEVAERLTAVLGTQTRTIETQDVIRVEVDVPSEITEELLIALITVLVTADRYGHRRTDAVDVVWAEITRLP